MLIEKFLPMTELIFDNRDKAGRPDVSIIIPHYNRPAELERAIKSCILQAGVRVEIIVVDDASPSFDIDRLTTYDGIAFIRLTNNSGAPVARNIGLGLSRSEFVIFLDSDDYLQDDSLKLLVDELKIRRPKGVVALAGSFDIVKVGVGHRNAIWERKIFRDNGTITVGEIFSRNPIGPLSKVLFLREVVCEVGGFDPILPACQDWDLYIRVADKGAIETTSTVVMIYSVQHNSITGSYEKGVNGRRIMFEKHSHIGRMYSIVFIIQSFIFFYRRWGWRAALRANAHYPIKILFLSVILCVPCFLFLYYKRRCDFV